MVTEAQLQKEILRFLRAAGAVAIVYPRTRYGRSGVSDILACYRGRFVAIEVKRPKRVPGQGGYGPTRLQEEFLASVHGASGFGIVTRTVDDVRLLLEKIDERESA
jgi:hypothetical protein